MTNLGKYNEGQLVYERVAFPTDTETVQAALKKIGIDGIRYEEIFIADYDGDMPQLYEHLGEYESINELNHLACLLSELSQDELAVFEAVMDSGEYTGSVKDLINLSQNLDSYSFYSDVHTEEDLGRMYLQELEAVPVPEHLIDYIDYEAAHGGRRHYPAGHDPDPPAVRPVLRAALHGISHRLDHELAEGAADRRDYGQPVGAL